MVTIVPRLVILRGRHRQNIFAIYHGNEAGFLANEKILDDHAMAGIAIFITLKHVFNGSDGLCFSFRNNYTFAGCQAVCLYHDRRSAGLHIGDGGGRVSESFKGSGRNAVAFQEFLGKSFGAFQLGGGSRWSKTGQSLLLEKINNAFY